MEVNLPQNLYLREAIGFCNRLWNLEHASEYNFNFRRLRYVEPFTMAYVANELKRFRNTRPEQIFYATNHEDKSYPAHMGFFKAFGLNHGNEPGQAPGSSTYIPLTIIEVSSLQEAAAMSFDHVGNIIEKEATNIAQLITRQDSGDLVDTLTFSIREIMRNVVEHSNSDVIEYCAQYWPSRQLVEVAILDTGIGIAAGLSSNPYLSIDNERDAMHLALCPGVSGKMYKGVRKRKYDDWQNSGFGLYMTSRICRNGGNFFIASNDKSLLLDSTGKTDIECNYHGTALRLRVDTSRITSYSEMLNKYKNEGFESAKKFSGNDAIEPSVASSMLVRDFQ
jgi:hypothetical protein